MWRWMSHKPRPTRGEGRRGRLARTGWRAGGLADCRRKGSNWMDVLSFTSGASRTAELPRRLATWSYMTLWQFQFWTTRGKMKFR